MRGSGFGAGSGASTKKSTYSDTQQEGVMQVERERAGAGARSERSRNWDCIRTLTQILTPKTCPRSPGSLRR